MCYEYHTLLRSRNVGLEKAHLIPSGWRKENHSVSCWEADHTWPSFFPFWILSDSLETKADHYDEKKMAPLINDFSRELLESATRMIPSTSQLMMGEGRVKGKVAKSFFFL